MTKILAVDKTFLTSKYGGVLLTVVVQDTKNYIYLVAFCVVDNECNNAWTFFFAQLKTVVDN